METAERKAPEKTKMLRVSADLHAEVKIRCVRDGLSIQDAAERAIALWLAKNDRREAA